MITIIAGTNRKNSVTLKVARYYEKLLNEMGENCQVLDLAKLPEDFVFSSLYGEENSNFAEITRQFIFKPSIPNAPNDCPADPDKFTKIEFF